MSAQEKWKIHYRAFVAGLAHGYIDNRARLQMDRLRREAALERQLAAAQRTIEKQAQRIDELEQDVDAFEQERNDIEAHVALSEFARSEFDT